MNSTGVYCFYNELGSEHDEQDQQSASHFFASRKFSLMRKADKQTTAMKLENWSNREHTRRLGYGNGSDGVQIMSWMSD